MAEDEISSNSVLTIDVLSIGGNLHSDVLTRLRGVADILTPNVKRRSKLRSAWGKVGNKNSWLTSRLFDLTNEDSPAKYVDDKTWNDLEFPKIISDINSTITPVGAQYLFRSLRRYDFKAPRVAARYDNYRALQQDRDF